MGNQLRLLDFKLSSTKEALNHELKSNLAGPNQNSKNWLLSYEQLWAKRSALLSRPNDHNTEDDFRRTCLSYKKILFQVHN
ncbi:unnamed protein product [Blepharisma stoltei]|uniref:Uncharacterized protein n=1 Tax=Blepharisma stoltei TaxID=1481888 RepID=A0AAU9JEB6_9CILI|nr:unnamed protein product [Blepharisma stoltei]